MSAELPVRRSARLLIVDADGRLLLFRYHDEHKPPFWATPGGELVGDETYEAAAARELREETGVELPIGPMVRERDGVYAVARSGPARWFERYFAVDSDEPFTPVDSDWTDEERETIRDHRWWSAEAMAATDAVFLPAWLPTMLAEILAARSGHQVG